MPLIVITGIPSSGKTTRTLELQKYFLDRGKIVHIVSEADQIIKAGFNKNTLYLGNLLNKYIMCNPALYFGFFQILQKRNIFEVC